MLPFLLVPLLISSTYGASCTNAKVDFEATTTADAFFHWSTAFIVEFDIRCQGEALRDQVLFAEMQGKLMPCAVAEETGKYQVSWTLPHADAQAGLYTVNVYDEDGHAAIRRAQRNNEDTSKIPSLASIQVNHPGAAKGAWLSTETIALVAAVVLWYYAYTNKSHLMS